MALALNRHTVLFVMALLAGTFASSSASASISRIGSYVLVDGTALGEIHPDVAYSDKSDAYLVVWGDGAGGASRPAFAQLVSRNGSLIGARLPLTSCGGELYGQRPRVIYTRGTTDDVFVVFYREWCSGTVNLWAHIVRYSSGGAVSVTRTSVRTTGKANGLVYNPQRKDVFLVWEEYASNTGFDALGRAVTFSRDGAGVITGFASAGAVIGFGQLSKTQGLPRIALDPVSQSYLVSFQGENPTTGANAMMVRTIDAATGAMSPLLFAAEGGYNVEASLVFLPQASQFLLTWRQGNDIVARRFTPVSGAAASSTYPLLARPGTDGATGAAYDNSANVGMVAGMNSDYTVWASEFSSSGAFVSSFQGSTAPPTPPGGGTFFPQVAATDDGGFGLTYGVDYKRVYLERFSASGGGTPPPPPPPASVTVTSLVADKSFPITFGTAVTFTASASGGTTPYTYKFVTYNASTGWAVTQDWSASNTMTYTPAVGTNAVQVWVRNAGSSSQYDAWLGTGYFTVNPSLVPVVTSFTTSTALPAAEGTAVTFTALTSGGTSPVQYKFIHWNAATGWAVGREYTSSNVFTYYPAAGTNVLQVWVRNPGSTAVYENWATSGYFTVTSAGTPVLTSFSANTSFPVPEGTPVTYTATAVGGIGPLQYKFVWYNAARSWHVGREYSTNNIFTYTPPAGNNVLQVWVRSAGSSAVYETWGTSGYFWVSPPAGLPALSSFVADKATPIPVGTPITFTATAVGGTGPLQYKFVYYNQNTGWAVGREYSTQNSFTYTPAAGQNVLQVWVRNAGSVAAYDIWGTSGYFTVTP